MTAGIYSIRNRTNQHQYIGSSKNIERRWIDHRRFLNYGNHVNPRLQNAWDRDGEASFELIIIEVTTQLEDREQFYIVELRPEYNLKTVVDRGWSLSQESRDRIGRAKKGTHFNLGIIFPKERCDNISKAKSGVPFSEEHKKALAEAARKRWSDPEKRAALLKSRFKKKEQSSG